MSYLIVGTPADLVADKEKQARVPKVLAAMAAKWGWHITSDANQIFIKADANEPSYKQVTYNTTTCVFSTNEDYPASVAILSRITGQTKRVGTSAVLSDTYQAIDMAIALEERNGWSWELINDGHVVVHETELEVGY